MTLPAQIWPAPFVELLAHAGKDLVPEVERLMVVGSHPTNTLAKAHEAHQRVTALLAQAVADWIAARTSPH